jgi:hypothetical protein
MYTNEPKNRFVPHSGAALSERSSPQSGFSKHFAASHGVAADQPSKIMPYQNPAIPSQAQDTVDHNSEIHQPVIFTDPGSLLPADPARDAMLQSQAEELVGRMNSIGLGHDSPEYLEHWNRLAQWSNRLLRQQFGGRAWTAHHIQSHHLGAASDNPMR